MDKVLSFKKPHLCLFAKKDILPGEEILYFYGVMDQPWYKEVNYFKVIIIYFKYYVKNSIPIICS